MTKRLWLIRHGQTYANLEGRFAGRSAEPLTPEGRCQAIEAGKQLRKAGIRRLYVSPLKRTLDTARLIVKGLGYEAEIIPEEAFLEINIPPWEGKKKSEIKSDPSLGYHIWWKTPHLFALPGCETLAQVQERALRRSLELFQEEGALVVTHMVVVRVLLCHFLGLGLEDYRSIPVPNATPILVSQEKGFYRVEAPFEILAHAA